MDILQASLILVGFIHFINGESIDGCPPADPNCHPSCIEYTAEHCRYCRCSSGESIDGCPPADPNCHPSCIQYTAEHCRYCRCTSGFSGSSSSSNYGSGDWSSGSGGMSTDQSWDNAISGDDWSSKVNSNSDAWSSSGNSGNSGSHYESEANVKYVIVEKTPDTYVEETSVLPRPFMGSGPMSGPMSAPMALPFSSVSHASPDLLPGSFSRTNTEYSSTSVIHVPLVAPGIPKYCVRCPILNCPGTCERIDNYGCHSCPCAPSRYQTMPINRDCSRTTEERTCDQVERCKRSCKDGFTVGDRDSSGCQTCSCIRYAPRPTAKPQGKECPATLSCMLKCKDGYVLGDKMANGCPSCRCLGKGSSENHQSSGSNHGNSNHGNSNYGNGNYGNSNGNSWSSSNGNGNGNSNSGSSSGNGDMYSGVSNGIGDGKCKPPMCLDGHMSVGEAMEIGKTSAGGGSMDSGSSYGSMTSSGGSGDSGNCYPMCASGTDSGSSMGGTNSGGSMTSTNMGGANSGCSGPFCATMGGGMGAGMGGGMAGVASGMGGMMGGGGGAGGKGFSPFAAAMSGMSPGMGMPGRGGMQKLPGSQSSVENAAYNHDCFGAECSAKNGLQHKDCPQLVHCMMTCDGYMLGELDSTGCQTCSCN